VYFTAMTSRMRLIDLVWWIPFSFWMDFEMLKVEEEARASLKCSIPCLCSTDTSSSWTKEEDKRAD
jgi:hypothetical protein